MDDSKTFPPVFLLELHAVEARRRRWRVEQLLGPPPEMLGGESSDKQPSTEASPPPAAAGERTLTKLEQERDKTKKAKAARDERIRLAREEARKGSGCAAKGAWRQAEEQYAAAARTLSVAAKEGAAGPSNEDLGGGTDASGQMSPPPPWNSNEVRAAYQEILAAEARARKELQAFCKAEPTGRPGAYRKFCGEAVQIAEAEVRLYEKAAAVRNWPGWQDCERAAAAAELEVQRTSLEGNLAQMETGTDPDRSQDLLSRARQRALDMDLVGLSLSGGGIRSATFALGVLQGLAQLRLLGTIDYLSTVSGGSYIGGWFAAWVKREGSLANVERQLSPSRVSQAGAARVYPPRGQAIDPEPEPVHHLRAYSRYLAPRFGLFSADTWTLFTIYLRNLFVNSLFLVPLAVGLVFLWLVSMHGYDVKMGPDVTSLASLPGSLPTWRFGLTLVFAVAWLVAAGCVFLEEESLFEAARVVPTRPRKAEHLKRTHFGILLPLFIVAVAAPWIFGVDYDGNRGKIYEHANQLRYFGQTWLDGALGHWPYWVRFAVCFAVPTLLLSISVRTVCWLRRGRKMGWNWRGLVANLVVAACFGTALFLVMDQVIWPLSYGVIPCQPGPLHLVHALGMPLMFGAMVLGGLGEMAIAGRLLSEYEREWRSRLAAYLLMGATAWLVMAAATLYAPRLLEQLSEWHDPEAKGSMTLGGLKALLGVAWGVISAGGAWAAGRGATWGRARPRPWWLRPLMTVAPLVFLVGLLVGVSAIGQWALDGILDKEGLDFLTCVTRQAPAQWLLVGLSLGLALVFGLPLNVNRTSLHMLYANRLTRCYLGASRRKTDRTDVEAAGSGGALTGVRSDPVRQTNLFTGFDPLDDLPLAHLRTVAAPAGEAGRVPYTGPLPLINCALNCLAGDELAYQDRRADAFLLSPEKCGGRLTGYADTPDDEASPANLTLGRAMTVSGAAVDPNMNGLAPPLTALMTVFNTRLGWWIENPRADRRPWLRSDREWRAREPGFGWSLLWEFLGLTNEDRSFVHISDGGHFENLGVYELIRRRCRYVIVVDGGTDRTAASDNMAAMLGLVRTDFGIDIELDPAGMQVKAPDGYSTWHCAIGRIRYDEVDEEAVPGVLVYLQATLTGDEPPDLIQYAARHPHFPRQSTINQFFDETQFECYRALGHHTAVQVFGEEAFRWSGRAQNAAQHRTEVQAVFASLRRRWLPPPPGSETEWTAASRLALQAEQSVAVNAALADFSLSLYPEVERRADVQVFHAVSATLQVMEAAWAAMKLDSYHAHPRNRGWMNSFRRWTSSPDFARHWPFLRGQYSIPFVRFCQDVLNLQPTQIKPERAGRPPEADADLRGAIERLDEQFEQEWSEQFASLNLPAEFAGPSFLARLVEQASVSQGKPLIWLLRQASRGSAIGQAYCCGVVCAAEPKRLRLLQPDQNSGGEEIEFFVWLPGAYRNLGIGTDAVRRILEEIEEEARCGSAKTPLRCLTVYYPLQALGSRRRLEAERWMNFFFDLGFRRCRQPDTRLGAKFAVLKRRLYRGMCGMWTSVWNSSGAPGGVPASRACTPAAASSSSP